MTAPPDTLRLWRNQPSNDYVVSIDGQPYPTGSPEYLLRDGPTMQAAIAAAEARGRERGLREAAAIAAEEGWPGTMSHDEYARLSDSDEAAMDCAVRIEQAILALIPAPPPADGRRGVNRHVQILRVPSWGLSIADARYYGRRWGLHIGPFMAFLWQLPNEGDT